MVSIDENAKLLGTYIQQKKCETGAKQVNVVAHSMGGLITRRYIDRYMGSRDINKLIMLGTPNGGSSSAILANFANKVTGILPPADELTLSALLTFNRENTDRKGVPFYAIAGLYNCPPILLDAVPNDTVVWTGSVFAIPVDKGWIYPAYNGKHQYSPAYENEFGFVLTGSCYAAHTQMTTEKYGAGGKEIFDLFVKPLLKGQIPTVSSDFEVKNTQDNVSAMAYEELSKIQFVNVKNKTLLKGDKLEFTNVPESNTQTNFIVIGKHEQMTVSLRDPNGRIITANTNDSLIQYSEMDYFAPMTIYTVKEPLAGVWTTIVEANQATPPEGSEIATLGSFVSDLRLTIPTDNLIEPKVGDTLPIFARLQANNAPIIGANVKANLFMPDKSTIPIVLLDDGQHWDGMANDGIYGYLFTPKVAGVYQSVIEASGNNQGAVFNRSNVWVRQVAKPTAIFLPLILSRSGSSSLINSDFESGHVGWEEYSLQGYPVIVSTTTDDVPISAHSGSWLAWLGGGDKEESSIKQTVTVSNDKPYLSFWYLLGSNEAVCGKDFAYIKVNNQIIGYGDLCLKTNSANWIKQTFDLTAFIGQTINIEFAISTDSGYTSNFFVDDVAFVGP